MSLMLLRPQLTRAVVFPRRQMVFPGLLNQLKSPLKPSGVRLKSDISTQIANIGQNAADADPSGALPAVAADQIGYFQSIGLAHSWFSPTGFFQHIFEYAHVYTGLPWWATILVVTLATRVFMFPLYTSSSDSSAKMARIKPELTSIMEKTKHATEQVEIQQAMLARRQLMKENNISVLSMAKPLLAVPIFIGVFGSLSGMASANVAGLAEGGLAWFSNLEIADPYAGLQIITAVLYSLTFRFFGGETGANQLSPVMKKVFLWMPFIAVPLTMSLPACVVFYFAINGVVSIVQSQILKSHWARRMLGLAPLVSKSEQEQINARMPASHKQEAQTIRGALRQRYEDAQEKAERKAEENQRTKQQKNDAEIIEQSRYIQIRPRGRKN